MDLKQLQAFLEIAVEGHYGRAAETLRVTQPALTQRIQALERELGVQLLKRSPREVRLTAAGEVLLPYARTLVQIEGHARRDLAENVAGRGGRLRLGYQGHGDMATQVRIVTEFRRRFPRVVVETSSGSSQENLERTASGELDAAFVAAPIEMVPGLALRPLTTYPLVLAMPRAHRFATLERVPVAQLRAEKLILTPTHMNRAAMLALRAWLVRHTGAQLNVIAEEPPDQAIEAVGGMDGTVAFVSGPVARSIAAPHVAFKSMSPAPLMNLAITYVRDNPAPILASLLRTVDEVVAGDLKAPPDGELLQAS